MGEEWRARDEDLDAIAAARSSDPFAVLGPHQTAAGWVIRVFAPEAVSVRALTRDGALIADLPRRKDDVFEALIPSAKERPAYRVEVDNRARVAIRTSTHTRSGRRWARSTTIWRERARIASSTAGSAPSSFVTKASTASCSPSGRRTRRAFPSSASSIDGTAGAVRCAGASTAACGRSSSLN